MLDARVKRLYEYLGQTVSVLVDRPVGYVHGDVTYPVNYGYLPGVMAGDGEEQDVYILGVHEPLSEFHGQVVGAVQRLDDCEDKLIVAPEGAVYHQAQIAEAVRFQEQFFSTRVISLMERSCGVLPYRVVDGRREFLLVFESYSQCWSLPKGHMEPGETEEQTALRELFEETGLTAQLDLSRSAMIEYPISQVARKQVVFYLGVVRGAPVCRNGEIERYHWVSEADLDLYLFPDTVAACRELLD